MFLIYHLTIDYRYCQIVNQLDAEECDNCCEQGNTLDEGSSHNHVGKQLVHDLRLTGHSVHGLTANLTNTKTCANGCETCTYSGAQFCDAFYCQ